MMNTKFPGEQFGFTPEQQEAVDKFVDNLIMEVAGIVDRWMEYEVLPKTLNAPDTYGIGNHKTLVIPSPIRFK